MQVRRAFLGALAMLVLAAPQAAPAAGAGSAAGARRSAIIVRVDDGRTLWIEVGPAQPVRVRLAWIAVPPAPAQESGGEPHGAEARQRLEVWRGQAVEVMEVGKGPDGVPLVEILWRPTGESVVTLNYEMVRSGSARADCSPVGEYALQCRVLRRAEDLARHEKRGLWAGNP